MTVQFSLKTLKFQLDEALDLNLDDFDLSQNQQHEFSARFVGVTLNTSFQPIYDIVKGDLHGYEAILRPSLCGIQESSAEFAYSYAKASNKLVKFDRLCRTLHVLNYQYVFNKNGLLFLSVHPDLLISVTEHGKVFERILHDYALPTEHIVIQIQDFMTTEQYENSAIYERKLNDAIRNYHDRGYKIAIENFGNKQSLLNRLWKIQPDYLKFDPNLITEASGNASLLKVLSHLSALANDIGTMPIITGIHHKEQFETATSLGAQCLQGDYLGIPSNTSKLKAAQQFKFDTL